jgi:hypothetical protein
VEKMKKHIVIPLLILFYTAGCGTVIQNDDQETSINQVEEVDEEVEESTQTISVKVFFPLPPIKQKHYPYDINGFFNNSSKRSPEDAVFFLVSY